MKNATMIDRKIEMNKILNLPNILLAIFMFIAFSSGYTMTFRADISGPGVVNVNGTKMINAYTPINIEVYGNNNDGYRSVWTSTFIFTGMHNITTAEFGSTLEQDIINSTVRGYMWLYDSVYTESWDGILPDLFSYTAAGFPGYPPYLGEIKIISLSVTLPAEVGSFCIDSGDAADDLFDWLFEDPVPHFTRTCWSIFSSSPIAGPYYCDGYNNHVVKTLTPTVYWTYFDIDGSPQSQYEIEVGTDEDWTIAELWSPGAVISSDTAAVYAGITLNENVIYYLRIRVKNGVSWGNWTNSWFIISVPEVIHIPADQSTIQAGIDVAIPGDTVKVAPGIYNERINFRGKSIVVKSEGGALITKIVGSKINNAPEPTVTIDSGDGSGMVLEGFTLQGGPIAIRVNNSALITKNILTDQTYPGWAALVVEGPAGIINNTICHGANGGIARYNKAAIIKNNIIVYNAHYGIFGSGTGTYNNIYANSPNYSDGATAGPGSIGRDPKFINDAARDYFLQYDSPCLDAGDPDRQYNDPDGTRNDMGALYRYAYPPELAAIGPQNALEGDTLRFPIYATSPNQTIPKLYAYSMPSGATFIDSARGCGIFSWIIPYKTIGSYRVLFITKDRTLADSELVTINVASAPPSVAGIQIDGHYPAMNITSHRPRISWDFHDPGNDDSQTEYEIIVYSILEINNDDISARIWNPGVINSSDTSVIYAGPPLFDGQSCYLCLRVYNGITWSQEFQAQFRMNSAPTVPIPVWPDSNAIVNSATPILYVLNSTDQESDTLNYHYEIINDGTYGDPILVSGSNIPQTPDSTGWVVSAPLMENWKYWWRSRAFDQFQNSDWSGKQLFWVNAVEESPSASSLIKLPDTTRNMVFDMLPEFNWTPSLDPDPMDSVHYTLYLALDTNFQHVHTIDNINQPSFQMTDSLLFGTKYWWEIKAADKTGRFTYSNILSFRTWKLGDANGDWNVNLLDVLFIINALYRGGTQPNPKYVGDFNGDCKMNLLDVSYLINYMYRDGAAPKIGCE
jgi:hypothetical protein